MKFDVWIFCEKLSRKFKFKIGQYKVYFTWRPICISKNMAVCTARCGYWKINGSRYRSGISLQMAEMCQVRILDLIPIFCHNDCVWSNLHFRLLLLLLLLLPWTMLDDSVLISWRWRWSEGTGGVKEDILYPSAVPTPRTRIRQWFILVLSRFRTPYHVVTELHVLHLSSLSPDFLILEVLVYPVSITRPYARKVE